jgi:hypothetical protein
MLPQFVNRRRGTGHAQVVKPNDTKPDAGLEALPSTKPCLDRPKSSTHKAASAHAWNMKLPKRLQWIPYNWTWSKIKPVIRCAVAAWIATVLFVIPRVQIFLGQVRHAWYRIRIVVLILELIGQLLDHHGCAVSLYIYYALSLTFLPVPFLSPPSDPLLAVVERESITLLFVTLAWA